MKLCSCCKRELTFIEELIIESVVEDGNFEVSEIDYVCSDCILYPQSSLQ